MREKCPAGNTQAFGSIMGVRPCLLMGSLLSPDYCIVDNEGHCEKHNPGSSHEKDDDQGIAKGLPEVQ